MYNALMPGNIALFSRPHPSIAPTAYYDLTGTEVPSWPLAATYLPFRDLARDLIVPQHGVILLENAPFDIMRNEIVAFLGRAAKIVQCPPGSGFHSVHVNYDRNLGKAYNVFVELDREEDAQEVVQSFTDYQAARGYPRRLRNRQVKVSAVGQEELMKAIFPRVKCCEFVGTVPYVTQAKEHESAFQGFLVEEELRSLVKFANKPGKTVFCKDSPQRPYEAMISLLAKYPWQSNDIYTLKERDMLFYYVEKMARQLLGQIPAHQGGAFHTRLNAQLLTELVVVACGCCGFNSNQQAHLVALTDGFLTMQIPISRLAFYAPFDCLAVHPGAQEFLVEYFTILIREGTLREDLNDPQWLAATIAAYPQARARPFGLYSSPVGQTRGEMTLRAIGEAETFEVSRILKTVLNYATENPQLHLLNIWSHPQPFAGPY
ncbi:hypothetical protein AOQ84DRAFT_226646 [Glonium stellatum]|uniref:RRM domain-containing protein n=1 Tax=Glonium stellatum TaxID=574774 RepID=A0A8E2JNS6_9PEZI|nr:hypothetical protein AOQ84DRAFT_226646 [Glonium stellatum]